MSEQHKKASDEATVDDSSSSQNNNTEPPPLAPLEKLQRHTPPAILRRPINRVFVIKKQDGTNSPKILTPVPAAAPGVTLQKFVHYNPPSNTSEEKVKENGTSAHPGASKISPEEKVEEASKVPVVTNVAPEVKLESTTSLQKPSSTKLESTTSLQKLSSTIQVNLTPKLNVPSEVPPHISSTPPTVRVNLTPVLPEVPAQSTSPSNEVKVNVTSSVAPPPQTIIRNSFPLKFNLTPLTVASSTGTAAPRFYFQPSFQNILNPTFTSYPLQVKLVQNDEEKILPVVVSKPREIHTQNIVVQPSLKSPETNDNLTTEKVTTAAPETVTNTENTNLNKNTNESSNPSEVNTTERKLIILKGSSKPRRKSPLIPTTEGKPKVPRRTKVAVKSPEVQEEVAEANGEGTYESIEYVDDEAGIVTLKHWAKRAGTPAAQDAGDITKRLVRKFCLVSPKQVIEADPIHPRSSITQNGNQKEDGPQRTLVPRILKQEFNVLKDRIERVVMMPMREVCLTEAETQTDDDDRLQSSFYRSPQLLKTLEKQETQKVLGKRMLTDTNKEENEPPAKKSSSSHTFMSGHLGNDTEMNGMRIESLEIPVQEDVEMNDADHVDVPNQKKSKKRLEKKRKLMKSKITIKNRGITITRDYSNESNSSELTDNMFENDYDFEDILNSNPNKTKNKEKAAEIQSKYDKISIICANRGLKKSEVEKAKFDFETCLKADNFGNLPIHQAVISRITKDIIRHCMVLAAHNKSVDIPNNAGLTPLHLSFIHNCNRNAIQKLLRYGGGLNLKDPKGNNVLHLAVLFSAPAGLEAVLPLVQDMVNEINEDGMSPLHLAVIEGKTEHVHFLLSVPTIDLDLPDAKSGRTALFHALESGHYDLARLLVKRGSSIEATNFAGQSILTLAAENESYKEIISVISRRRILKNKMEKKKKKKT